MTRNIIRNLVAATAMLTVGAVHAAKETYEIDPAHTFIEFAVSHIGFGVLKGRFNDVTGTFVRNTENPGASSVEAQVKTASLDSNHAERDKHLRSGDFLNTGEFAIAKFESTSFSMKGKEGTMKGNLTLHGVTKPVEVDVEFLGEGKDPWGGYRIGYVGRTTIQRSEFGIDYNLGPATEAVELTFFIEGVRK